MSDSKQYIASIEMEVNSDTPEHAAEQFLRAIQEDAHVWSVDVTPMGELYVDATVTVEVEPSDA